MDDKEGPDLPRLEWAGPDEDGDLLVSLTVRSEGRLARLTAHGKTPELALAMLGDAMHAAWCADCRPEPVVGPDPRD